MTKEEALKLALEALESALSDDKPYIVKCGEAITAIKEALAQPDYGWTPERIAGMARLKAQQDSRFEPQERNFCPRCGKRTADIHTCTPPKDAR